MRRLLLALVIALAAVCGGGVVPARPGGPVGHAAAAEPAPDVVRTHFYDLRREAVTLPHPAPWVVAVGADSVVAVGPDVADPLDPSATVTTYPMTGFDVGTGAARTLGDVDLAPAVGRGAQVRLLDVAFLPQLQPDSGRRIRLLLAFASLRDGCRRSHLHEVLVDPSGGAPAVLGREWFRLPCIRTTVLPDGSDTGPVLHHSGGRIALARAPGRAGDRDAAVYLSVGDFQIIKAGREAVGRAWPMLGTVLRVPGTGRPQVVASGLRNPQGLTRARLDGRDAAVATAHGSRGGDVLVRVRRGADFGWPRESYGTVYEGGPSQHRTPHDGALPTADLPAFAWVPSIGTGEVVQVRGAAFDRWWGRTRDNPTADLLVSGMAARSLYRIRWQAGAVRYVEPIPIGYRVRSLAQVTSGTLVAGTDEGALLVATPQATWSSATGSYRSAGG